MESAFAFTPLVATKLIVYTFGSLVHLFLMVLILGQRRLRTFEWLLFWLMAALFMWNSGNLLSLNVSLQYGVAPNGLAAVSRLIPFVGLIFAAPLLVHVHVSYAGRLRSNSGILNLLVVVFYLPLAAAPWMLARLLGHLQLDALQAIGPFIRPVAVWIALALAAGAILNLRLRRRPEPQLPRAVHLRLAASEGFLAAGLVWAFVLRPLPVVDLGGYLPTFVMLMAIVPSALAGFAIFRNNFLELRVQRNLAYTIITIFAFLIYLDVIRRVSAYLDWKGIVPAAVTETVMIFTLVVLFEPAKKLMNRALRSAFATEFERVQKLSAEVQECAQQTGDARSVKRLVEDRVPKELGLRRAELMMGASAETSQEPLEREGFRGFAIRRGDAVLGFLRVEPTTRDLSGDQSAALQLLADQLAAALELCKLIADKVKLERELAEKAQMAFLGEMAARIAHNVKNPLSSMKTIVQLMGEDLSLPERVREDCRLVTGEIDHLNSNISQVLRYAKPARDVDHAADLAALAQRIFNLSRADADRRGVRLEFEHPSESSDVLGGEEAASDIISNLLVNALDATGRGRRVRVKISGVSSNADWIELAVEDEGPGIAREHREKIFKPFFTTRPGGTGLGLAIVARRAEEIGGAVECLSPLTEQGGARFLVRFRSARNAHDASALNREKPFVET